MLNLQKSWVKTFCTAGGIIAWLALGPKLGFGNEWQLDVNTATAVELMIVTTFLQNTKRRHRLYMHRCSAMLTTIDQELEERLVSATNDFQVGCTKQMLLEHNILRLYVPRVVLKHCASACNGVDDDTGNKVSFVCIQDSLRGH